MGDAGGSEGAVLLPLLPLLAGELGGVEAVELLLDWDPRPWARLTPLVCSEQLMSVSMALVPLLLVTGEGVVWTQRLLLGGGDRGGGDLLSRGLFIALCHKRG